MLRLAGEMDAGIGDHEVSLSPHLMETLPVLLKGGNVLHIPTNAGWTSTVVGSGSAGQGVSTLYLNTGSSTNSSARFSTNIYGFNIGNAYTQFTFDKKMYFIFNYCRVNSENTATGFVQLKTVGDIGPLAAKGFGLRVDNLSLVGESYGTALGTVDLATTLVSAYTYQIVIVFSPGVPKIEWYVRTTAGGQLTLKGSQTTAAYIPSGQSGDYGYMVDSIANGEGVSSSAVSLLFHPKIWQEA